MRRSATEQVGMLVQMEECLTKPVLDGLREADKPDPKTRLDKIWAASPRDYEKGVYGNAGNSTIHVFDDQGRRTEEFISGLSVLYLSQRGDDHCIAVYPYGIVGVTEAGEPIFEQPDTSQRQSVVIEYTDPAYRAGLLQRKVVPLYNIDSDGRVYARMTDQPTPTELQLFYDILNQFEEVTDRTT